MARAPAAELAVFIVLKDSAREQVEQPSRDDIGGEDGWSTTAARIASVPADVEDELAMMLPTYMMPSACIFFPRLPVSASGKTDRRALRDMGANITVQQLAELRTGSRDSKRAPSSEVELSLQSIWAKVLNVDLSSIGVDDSFVRLGGDSITAMQVSSLARAENLNVSTADILQRKTIAHLAAAHDTSSRVVESWDSSGPFSSAHEIAEFHRQRTRVIHMPQLSDIEDVFPCSPMQEGMLLARDKDSRVYVTGFGLEILATPGNKPVTFARIQQAWQAVVRRHALLRALLMKDAARGGQTMQVVLRDPRPSISYFEREADSLATSRSQSVFHPVSFRPDGLQHHLSVYQTDKHRAYLRFEMSHAITDGHSSDILLENFQLAYEGRPASPAAPYAHFATYLESRSRVEGDTFWSHYLQDVEPCMLPTSQTTAALPRGTLEVDVPLVDALKMREFCTKHEVTPANVLQAAWALVLRQQTGSTTPCFGNINSGRDVAVKNVDGIFGPLLSLLPCRIRLDEPRSVLSAVTEAHEDFLRSLSYQTNATVNTQRYSQADRSPLFNTAISVVKRARGEASTSDGHTMEMENDFDPVEYDVYIRVAYDENEVDMTLECWAERLPGSQGVALAKTFGMAIDRVLTHPEADILALTL